MIRLVPKMISLYRKLPIRPLRVPLHQAFVTFCKIYRHRRLTAMIEDFRYELDLGEVIDAHIFYEGCFEPATRRAIKALCNPGMTVLDIGANVGCHTLLMARLVGQGKVIAFEPMPWARAKLLRNIELNGFQNIVVEGIALSDAISKAQTVSFRSSWRLDGGVNPEASRGVIVDFETLDAYLQRRGIRAVDLIKLDVDGYEFKVLRGACGTISRSRPPIIIELGSYTLQNVGDTLSEMVDYLMSLGYEFYHESSMKLFPGKDSVMAAVSDTGTINVICIAHGRDARANHVEGFIS